jgi:hypothetical protein
MLYKDIREILEIWERHLKNLADNSLIKLTREGVFFAGQNFDALMKVKEIIDTATNKIFLVDGFADEKFLNLTKGKNTSVSVNIMTKKVAPTLKGLAEDFNKQYTGLNIRISDSFHDRFLVIDNRDFFHLGTSINYAGKRGFMFSLIEEPVVIQSLKKEIDKEWENAAIFI